MGMAALRGQPLLARLIVLRGHARAPVRRRIASSNECVAVRNGISITARRLDEIRNYTYL